MGVSRLPAELASKLRHAGGAIDGAARDGVFKAALLVKTSVVAQIGTTRLRGVGRKGAKVGVRFDVKGQQNPTALVRATGPLHLLERSTRPHEIRPKRRGGKAVVISGVGPRAYAHHPGTKGKHPWERGLARALPQVPEVMMREQQQSLRRYFS